MLDYRARSIAALAFLVSLLSYGESRAAETAPKKDLPLPGQVFSVQGASAYGLTAAQLEAQLSQHNPIDRLAPLAKAGVPIFHIHGDADTLVPLEANSAIISCGPPPLQPPATNGVRSRRGMGSLAHVPRIPDHQT